MATIDNLASVFTALSNTNTNTNTNADTNANTDIDADTDTETETDTDTILILHGQVFTTLSVACVLTLEPLSQLQALEKPTDAIVIDTDTADPDAAAVTAAAALRAELERRSSDAGAPAAKRPRTECTAAAV